MSWTLKAILGLVAIILAWCFGWVVVLFILMSTDHRLRDSLSEFSWLRWAGVLPAITYILAGPVLCFMYIRWIGRRAAKEHENRTRRQIAELRKSKNQGSG